MNLDNGHARETVTPKAESQMPTVAMLRNALVIGYALQTRYQQGSRLRKANRTFGLGIVGQYDHPLWW